MTPDRDTARAPRPPARAARVGSAVAARADRVRRRGADDRGAVPVLVRRHRGRSSSSVLVGAGILVLAVVTDAPTGIARIAARRLARRARLRAGAVLDRGAVRVRLLRRRRCRDGVLHRARASATWCWRCSPATAARSPRLERAPGADLSPRCVRGLEAQAAAPARADRRGRAARGWKIALNDPRVQRALGIGAPVIGYLDVRRRSLPDGARHSLAGATRPAIEPEVAVHVGRGRRDRGLGRGARGDRRRPAVRGPRARYWRATSSIAPPCSARR